MSTEYGIEPVGNAFIVIDDLGEPVGRYPTEEAARQDIERCKLEDEMVEDRTTVGQQRYNGTHAASWW